MRVPQQVGIGEVEGDEGAFCPPHSHSGRGVLFTSCEPRLVPLYRALHLDEAGFVGATESLDARCDEEAKVAAETTLSAHGVDRWARARYVARYPPRSADRAVSPRLSTVRADLSKKGLQTSEAT